MPSGPVRDAMHLLHLFLAGLQTSLFSLETASVLSHSNLKIEMSLLGAIAVMAATSFVLFNCAVNIWRLFSSAQCPSYENGNSETLVFFFKYKSIPISTVFCVRLQMECLSGLTVFQEKKNAGVEEFARFLSFRFCFFKE